MMGRFSIISLFFTAALTACGGSAAVEDLLDVSPSALEFSCESGQKSIDVKANCSWTAEIPGEDWAILSKSKGSGDGKVNVFAMENQYKSERTAELVFKTRNGKTSSVIVRQAGNSGGGDVTVFEARVGTYNLRMSNLDNDSADNKWDVRKGRLLNSIQENGFDVFGVEEVDNTMQKWLSDNLGSTYGMYFFSPYSSNGQGDKAHGVLYRKGTFEFGDTHYFWMGPDPSSKSESDTGTQGNFCRGGFCGVVKHKGTGIRFFFMCTHACLNEAARNTYAYIYELMEKKYNTEGLPSIFVGDLNAIDTAESVERITSYWKDSYTEVAASARSGIANTYNAYSYTTGKNRIDYVFFRGNATPVAYCCNNKLYGEKYPSDHFPVYVDFEIRK